jgi:hypothetical protein
MVAIIVLCFVLFRCVLVSMRRGLHFIKVIDATVNQLGHKTGVVEQKELRSTNYKFSKRALSERGCNVPGM